MKTQKILSLVLAIAMVFSVGCVSAFAEELANSDTPLVYDNVTDTLDLSTLKAEDEEKALFEANGCDGAIRAEKGANLTINGGEDDCVRALAGQDSSNGKYYSMAVWAKGEGTVVTINGGNYSNERCPNEDPQADMIYASEGAKIVINGGTFECATPEWTLNCKDNSGSTIIVKGGKFSGFNPDLAQTGEGEIVVPAGYTVVEKDGWYEVVSNAKVCDNKTEILTLSDDLIADGEDGAIWAKNGAKLTINGNDDNHVLATYVTKYTMAVWAQGSGTEVTINGGYYTNEGDPNNTSQADLIYASDSANIVITGGTFECVTPRWTLNCKNGTKSTITVQGGKFYQFDPSNAQTDGEGEIVVPEGYTVVNDGDWYKVVEVTGGKTSIAYDSASSAEVNGEGALRFVFKVTIPEAKETYFGAYLLPLNIFKESGVANAVQVQYGTTEVKDAEKFSADLVKIPSTAFGEDIYAIPYIKTANGVETFAGASASVNSAKAQ